MELVAIEMSRLVYLSQVTRPSGQLYLPEAAQKIVARYSFAKGPGSFDELAQDIVTFRHGKFGDIAIEDMIIYPDGVIISSRSNTQILDAYCTDLFEWINDELGLVEIKAIRPDTFYDSQLIVRSEKTLDKSIKKVAKIGELISEKLTEYGAAGYSYRPFGFSLEVDGTKYPGRKPNRFAFERRAGLPFESQIYYSVAPLRTADHIALLSALEEII